MTRIVATLRASAGAAGDAWSANEILDGFFVGGANLEAIVGS